MGRAATDHARRQRRGTGNGDSGRDKIFAGLGAAAAILTGGSGRDLLVPAGFAFNDAKGGTGTTRS